MDNIVDWLQNWTMSQIDGDWEHELGVSRQIQHGDFDFAGTCFRGGFSFAGTQPYFVRCRFQVACLLIWLCYKQTSLPKRRYAALRYDP